MRTIAITGGIGAGKSTLLDAFARRGASVFSADSVVHKLYDNPDIIAELREHWGERIFNKMGKVDRVRIAEIVFPDAAERRWLERLLHPKVGKAWEEFLQAQSTLSAPPTLVVAEVPLLFEAGLSDRYDTVIVVTAPETERIRRADARSSLRPDESVADVSMNRQRAQAQLSDAEKVRRADIHFENTGTIEDIEQFVESVASGI